MRKILAVGLVLVMVVIGFTAMVNPVASDPCGKVIVCKQGTPTCHFGAYPVGLWDNDNVPLNTWVTWLLQITITNTHSYAIEDVYIWDRLGAELMLMDDDPDTPGIQEFDISQGDWFSYTKGGSDKVFIEWDVGDIPAGGTAYLTLGIGTDTNPAGKQEYTSPGEYYLNSGATAKWFVDGVKNSASSNRIMVTVPEP